MHPSSQSSIDSFVDALWLEDGLSPNTLAASRRDLTLYAQWLDAQGLALNDSTETLLNSYFAAQHATTRATSANRRLSVFKRYFHWALREGFIHADPTLKLQSAKQALRVPKTLSQAQVEALLHAPDVDTPLGLRDRTMLELMYASGRRVSELVTLKTYQLGLAEGVLRICKICDVPAVIAVRRDATLAGSPIDALCRAGQKDDFIDPKDALPIISKRTLCIVVDTYQVGLVESKDILEKCGKVAVIDHHRKGVGYIENPALVCHEPYSSSASELVTELLQYVGERDDKPNRVEAEGLLAGILLDTQDFTLHTGVRTFEAAAALRRYGAETERVRQLFDVTMVEYNAKAALVEAAQMYKGCAISVGGEVAPEARVAVAQAANDLLTIQGVDASFVAVPVGTGVNVSARSLGAVNVQVIMESLGGGGHQTMAAAQLKHITPEAVRSRIQTAIDQYREAQKKSGLESESEQKKKDKQ